MAFFSQKLKEKKSNIPRWRRQPTHQLQLFILTRFLVDQKRGGGEDELVIDLQNIVTMVSDLRYGKIQSSQLVQWREI